MMSTCSFENQPSIISMSHQVLAGEKAAGWLLKFARQVTVKDPVSGEEESVFVPKFGSYLQGPLEGGISVVTH